MARRENAKPDDMSAGGRTVPDNRRVPESVWLRGATIALTLSGWRLLEYSLARLSADNCDAGGGIHASGSTNEFRNRYRCQCGPVRLALTVPPLGSRARRGALWWPILLGLRATTSGGHYAVEQSVRAQFGDGFRPFGALRRRRNELEYPHLPADTASSEEAEYAAGIAQLLIVAASKLLPQVSFFSQD
jgi:hypothetical protein